MSTAVDAQVQFAAEFALFLVALAGLALALLRSELLTSSTGARLLLSVGFASLAGAAFVHGSLLAEAPDDPTVVAAQAAGWVAVAGGATRWTGRRLSRRLVVLAAVMGLAGVGAAVASADALTAGLRGAAALAVGGALLLASRGAIAARVAASAAATLLLIVLVLSVGLSAVLTSTVEDQALDAVDARALREASLVEEARNEAITAAGFVSLGISTAGQTAPLLLAVNERGSATPEERTQLDRALVTFGRVFLGSDLVLGYVDAKAGVVAASGLPAGAFADLVGAASEPPAAGPGSTGDVVAVGDAAVAVGVVPVRATDGQRLLGSVVAGVEIDADYLEERAGAEDPVALALWGPGGPIASFGEQASRDDAARLAEVVLAGGDGASSTTSSHFVSVRSVRGRSNEPLFALVASRPTDAVDDIRERLFRTFFVIAFGGTVLALLLATFVGDRIGAGVRTLTRSVEALERGEPGVRSGVHQRDELGRLGVAFDSMAASIEEKTDALRAAAVDEERLRNRLEAVVAGMGEALVAVDGSGAITDFNAAAEELFGREADDVKGLPVRDVVRLVTDDGVDVGERLTGVLSRWSDVALVRGPAGDRIPVAVTSGPLRGPEGEDAGRVLVFRDLRAEQEVERMKREFLSRVGHELRTPLTPLLGYARLLAGRDVAPERARDVAQVMVSSGERLQRIVEMLEFFASLQAGRTVLHPEPVDVRDLLAEVVDARKAEASGEHVLTRRVRSETPPVLGDRYWLARSLEELLDNAIKFSPGGGRISVTAALLDEHVEISVRDSGIGMSAEQVDRAFTEWSQGDESDTRTFGGLGLGLPLVQRVAERHGGRVECESTPGKGTRFSLLLPVAPDAG
ncbi:MAG TPA: ATP-binding protein [Acidimicrobiales bacterium]|nr:ATP-binding protein [Acidimicrobiales bacterium]